jgi:hypothetical protein
MDPFLLRFKIFLLIFLSVMVLGISGFMLIEGLSFINAFYFSIVTLATVGYGDIHPLTTAGKILAIVMIVMGVGTFLGVIANATEMMLNQREKKARLEKLNMVIGVFFSEVGRKLLALFSSYDPQLESIKKDLIISDSWSDKDFVRAMHSLNNYPFALDSQHIDFQTLREFLLTQRNFLLRLLENPTLLEHESFTELLRAVFHLNEELDYRKDVTSLPQPDRKHLSGDAKRAYALLISQWLHYMKYLKNNYPYLFSLAIRMNPFDHEASPFIR